METKKVRMDSKWSLIYSLAGLNIIASGSLDQNKTVLNESFPTLAFLI